MEVQSVVDSVPPSETGSLSQSSRSPGSNARQPTPIGVLVVPYDSKNPYQELLYGPLLTGADPAVRLYRWKRQRWIWPLSLAATSVVARARGTRIVHLHWLVFSINWAGDRSAALSGLSTRLCLWWLRLLGLRMVWTAHNIVPHEPQTSDDRLVLRRLVRQSVQVIVHSTSAEAEIHRVGLPVETAVVPHGNYVGRYPTVARREARAGLGLPTDGRVFLFVGIIRPYKGLDDLVAASDVLSGPDLLAIVGEATDPAVDERLGLLAGERLVRRAGVVPEEELGRWLSAADVVCLPFRRVTTSGSALLALSSGVPVVAPRLGALEDLPEEVGFFYEPADPGGLRAALRRASLAPPDELRTRGRDALRFAQTLDWARIAARTLEIYRTVDGRGASSV